MKNKQVWVVTYEFLNEKHYSGFGQDIMRFNTKKEANKWAISWINSGRSDFSAYKLEKVVQVNPNADYGGPLGSWMFNDEHQLEFYRSRWQGD